MKKKFLINFLTLGPIGHLPASGTIATLFSLTFIMLFNFLKLGIVTYLEIIICSILFALYAIYKSLFYFGTFNTDPREIVIDEVIGTFITFIYVPFNIYTVFLGIILFRFFDIAKPFGIKKLERCGKYFGILVDDIAAGIISNILLQLTIYAYNFKFN